MSSRALFFAVQRFTEPMGMKGVFLPPSSSFFLSFQRFIIFSYNKNAESYFFQVESYMSLCFMASAYPFFFFNFCCFILKLYLSISAHPTHVPSCSRSLTKSKNQIWSFKQRLKRHATEIVGR